MITQRQALDLCQQHFPDGLDRLVRESAIEVHEADLNIDGWCYRRKNGIYVVFLNRNATKERRRFTLAHEIAHFLLGDGTSPMALFKNVLHYDPKSPEERAADDLASRLLLPTERVREFLGDYLVDYYTIKRLQSKAKVSDIAIALRLAKGEHEFALDEPTVVSCDRYGVVDWMMPTHRRLAIPLVSGLFQEAWQARDSTATRTLRDGRIVIGSVLPNRNYPTMFLHYAEASTACRCPEREDRRVLEDCLFDGDAAFRNKLNGRIGGNGARLEELGASEAVEFLMNKYGQVRDWDTEEHLEKFLSEECQEWLVMRIESL